MKKTILVAISTLVVSCSSTSSFKFNRPDGSVAYQISCRRNITRCLEEAKTVCGGAPYNILERSMHWADRAQAFDMSVACWQ